MLPQLEEIASECRINTIVFMRIVEQISQFGGEESILIDEAFINVEPALKAAAEKYLNSVANRLALKRVSMETEVVFGPAAESIADYAEQHDISLILIATHGRSGVSRWVMGSGAGSSLLDCAGINGSCSRWGVRNIKAGIVISFHQNNI